MLAVLVGLALALTGAAQIIVCVTLGLAVIVIVSIGALVIADSRGMDSADLHDLVRDLLGALKQYEAFTSARTRIEEENGGFLARVPGGADPGDDIGDLDDRRRSLSEESGSH